LKRLKGRKEAIHSLGGGKGKSEEEANKGESHNKTFGEKGSG